MRLQPAGTRSTSTPESAAANAVGSAEFADLMSELGPYEAKPALAVAVSGGADSLALAILLRDWVRDRDGSLLALVVDHGLRAESASEAAWVAKSLRSLNIPTRVLRWTSAGQHAGSLQAVARAARYELLGAACARRGVLHLALAHHLQDQAETFLLRLSRGSGLEGLGAMAPVADPRRT